MKIKKRLDKNPQPTKLLERKFIIEHLGRIRIISDIFKERKKHDKKEKLLYVAALSEIKRFFIIFEKLCNTGLNPPPSLLQNELF